MKLGGLGGEKDFGEEEWKTVIRIQYTKNYFHLKVKYILILMLYNGYKY